MTFIKKTLKNIALIFLGLLSIINKVIPKKKRILFFTNNKNFNDNNKALLTQLHKRGYANKYEIIYCSKDKNKYQPYSEIKYRSTLFAPFYFLRSKYCFYDAGTIKISPSNKQKVISLWHGIPLKKIGALVGEKSSFLDKYNDFSKILVPHPSLAHIYMASFECHNEQILINGFPRNDFLFSPSPHSLEKLGIQLNYKKHFLWMPTFRKSLGGRYNDSQVISNWDLPLFSSKEELSELNKKLVESESLLVIKLHPYSVFNQHQSSFNFSNIKLVSNADLNKHNIINYEFIANFDCLITDYSSVFFDFLLTNKPIAFTLEDLSSYKKGRGFTINNPLEIMVGEQILNKEDFYKFIFNICSGIDDFLVERKSLKKRIHRYPDNQATTRLIEYLKL